MRIVIVIVIVIASLSVGASAADRQQLSAQQQAELSAYYGFAPFQMYRMKPGIAELKLADLDNDGRTDIALWNNYQNRSEPFYQPNPDHPAPADDEHRERHEVPHRGNMRPPNVPAPPQRTGSAANTVSSARAGLTPKRIPGTSWAVSTARTPGSAAARLVSMRRIRA